MTRSRIRVSPKSMTITIGKNFLINILIKVIGLMMIVQGVKTQSVQLAVFGFIIGIMYIA